MSFLAFYGNGVRSLACFLFFLFVASGLSGYVVQADAQFPKNSQPHFQIF